MYNAVISVVVSALLQIHTSSICPHIYHHDCIVHHDLYHQISIVSVDGATIFAVFALLATGVVFQSRYVRIHEPSHTKVHICQFVSAAHHVYVLLTTFGFA